MVFLPNIVRWYFAVWAKVDQDRWPIYGKVRLLTFWLFWSIIMFITALLIVLGQVNKEDERSGIALVNIMIVFFFLMVLILVDFHFTLVI